MNAHANISYSAALAEHYREVRTRIGWTAPEKPIENAAACHKEARPVRFVQIRTYVTQDSHVRLWKAWKAMTGDTMQPGDYIAALCYLAGITVDQFKGPSRKRYLVKFRHSIIRSVAYRYPQISSNRIGELTGREHTGVLHAMGQTKKAQRLGIWPVRGKAG